VDETSYSECRLVLSAERSHVWDKLLGAFASPGIAFPCSLPLRSCFDVAPFTVKQLFLRAYAQWIILGSRIFGNSLYGSSREKRTLMTQTAATSTRELATLLVYRRRLSALLLVEQHHLDNTLTEREYQDTTARLAQLSRFVDAVNKDLLQVLEKPLRS